MLTCHLRLWQLEGHDLNFGCDSYGVENEQFVSIVQPIQRDLRRKMCANERAFMSFCFQGGPASRGHNFQNPLPDIRILKGQPPRARGV